MIVVIIAGGSGTRLWPLSTPDYPKHLLTINGDQQSLLQNTYKRAKRLADKIYVIPEIGHAHHVREQLPALGDDAFVVEPGRRGTANCIVAALVHLKRQKVDENEAIVFLSADHYIRDTAGFVSSFKLAAKAAEQAKRIVLVGVEPDYPATGFGYIEKGDQFDKKEIVFGVKAFKEKPDFELAQQYVKSGKYLWNCGYFVAPLEVFLVNMEKHAPGMFKDYHTLLATHGEKEYNETYLSLENNTIDYALIENVDDLLVVPALFDWMDLGSYGDLHKAVEKDQQGNHIHGNKVETHGVENSFIQNHEDKPLAVIGLDNVAVINTPHGILVTRKDLSQQVGEVSKRFNRGDKL